MSAAVTYLYGADHLGVDISDSNGYFIFWVARFLAGLAVGAATAVVPTYLAEIAPSEIRGAIGVSNQFTVCFGILVTSVVGYRYYFDAFVEFIITLNQILYHCIL